MRAIACHNGQSSVFATVFRVRELLADSHDRYLFELARARLLTPALYYFTSNIWNP